MFTEMAVCERAVWSYLSTCEGCGWHVCPGDDESWQCVQHWYVCGQMNLCEGWPAARVCDGCEQLHR